MQRYLLIHKELALLWQPLVDKGIAESSVWLQYQLGLSLSIVSISAHFKYLDNTFLIMEKWKTEELTKSCADSVGLSSLKRPSWEKKGSEIMQCILTAGDFWEASTPGLLGLAQHCQPLILPSCWSARAGEMPVCYVSVCFFSPLLDSNMFHSHRVYFLPFRLFLFHPHRRGLLTIYMANLVRAASFEY